MSRELPVSDGARAAKKARRWRTSCIVAPLACDPLVLIMKYSDARAPELPDVPTTSEAIFRDADYTFWVGLFAPSRTPRTVINKLHDEAAKALETATVREKLACSQRVANENDTCAVRCSD
jgi:Tripartite tricarboxylate transporter family receptor